MLLRSQSCARSGLWQEVLLEDRDFLFERRVLRLELPDVGQRVGEDFGLIRQWLLLLAIAAIVVVSSAAAPSAVVSLLAAAHVGERLAQRNELAVHVHPVALLDDIVGELLSLVSLRFLGIIFLCCFCCVVCRAVLAAGLR